MCLERKVARVEEAHIRVRYVPFECLRTGRQEERIVLSPHCQKWRIACTEIVLELGIQRDVALIVAQEIELNFIRASACEVEIVQRKPVRRHESRVGNAVR